MHSAAEEAVHSFLSALAPASSAAFARLGAFPSLALHARCTADNFDLPAVTRAASAFGRTVVPVLDATALLAALENPTEANAPLLPTVLFIGNADALLAPGADSPVVAHLLAALSAHSCPPVVAVGNLPLHASLASVFSAHRFRAAPALPPVASDGGDEPEWGGVGGLSETKRRLRSALLWPSRHGSTLARLGARASRGVLLHGPPGCAKTTLVRAAAAASGARFVSLSPADVYSCFLGEAERIVRDAFAAAREAAPCILFLDEVDAIAGSRDSVAAGSGGGVGVGQRVLATLLTEMDGVASAPGVVVVAATNRLEAVDDALRRPGRFDDVLEVPLPDETARRDILSIHCEGVAVAGDVDLDELARRTDGLSGADLRGLCKEAALAAAREMWEGAADGILERVGKVCVQRRHFAVLS